MKKLKLKIKCYVYISLLIFGMFVPGFINAQQSNSKTTKIIYPKSNKENITDNYFGTKINDPYRWLEDPTAPDTKAWVYEENKLTSDYISKIPFYLNIKKRLEELWNDPKTTGSFKEGDYTFFYKNDGLQNQNVLYRQKDSAKPEVFLDPNKWPSDGTTSLSEVDFTDDGSLGAYQISEDGADWHKLVILRTSDKKVVDDTLFGIRYSSVVWKGDEGFYYAAYTKHSNWWEPIKDCKLYFHKIGTSQIRDSLIFNDPNIPGNMIGIRTTKDKRYLIISESMGLGENNNLYIQDLTKLGSSIIALIKNFNCKNQFVDNDGNKFFIITNLDAPNYKEVIVDVDNPAPSNWKVLIPETKNVLSGVSVGGGKLFANYLKDVTSQVVQYNANGKFERIINLPGMGTASGFSGNKTDKVVYYTFTSYIYPSTVFKYNIATGKSEVFKKADELKFFDPTKYEAKKVFYTSKDGTKIPMIINYKKGTKLNGKNPTLLYGYGGFGVSLTPAFNISNVILLEQGGILAVANLRGGGEYGEKWHIAATKMHRQNAFDDFISAAEYLINNKYTSKNYLAIHGISNGGLLAGAVLSQRPDLFKVALVDVGALDMLRYNKVGAGPIFTDEFGTAEDSKEMFDYLAKYSPYNALELGPEYPATLICASSHDETLGPFPSYKFAARLQEYQAGAAPVLCHIELNIGHGYGKPTSMIIEEQADEWAFLFYNMGIKLKY